MKILVLNLAFFLKFCNKIFSPNIILSRLFEDKTNIPKVSKALNPLLIKGVNTTVNTKVSKQGIYLSHNDGNIILHPKKMFIFGKIKHYNKKY